MGWLLWVQPLMKLSQSLQCYIQYILRPLIVLGTITCVVNSANYSRTSFYARIMDMHTWCVLTISVWERSKPFFLTHLPLVPYICSAVQSPKSWVAQRTTHGGWLGGPYYLWVIRNDNKTLIMTSMPFVFHDHQGLYPKISLSLGRTRFLFKVF